MFANIPDEMKAYRQWVVWRFERRDGAKDTKVPYSPLTRQRASVTNPADWCSYAEAMAAVEEQLGSGGLQTDSSEPGIAGLGFVLTEHDPYGFIDLDDTHGDKAAYDRQVKIYNEFDSYSELSPSGNGLHIIVKGSVPHGRKRSSIEVYSNERYMTMTGNVMRNVPIAERNPLLNVLWDEMGGPPIQYTYGQEQEQKLSDEEVLTMANRAVNGDKFARLWAGDFSGLYPSQSEADFALMDILGFYSQNRAQLHRLFRQSALGQREKAQRDRYLDYMVTKSFDRQLPPLDLEGILIAFKNMVAVNPDQHVYVNTEAVVPAAILPGQRAAGEPGGNPAALSGAPYEAKEPLAAAGGAQQAQGQGSPCSPDTSRQFPPGLVGEIAQFIYDVAPRPVAEIALAGSIGFLAGITGRAYNVSGTGLNQYVLTLAPTGTGKEAIALGTDKLMEAIKTAVPSSADFVGPGEVASAQALIKWLANKPAIYSIVGEFGLRLAEMSSPRANPHLVALKRVMLDLYHKSAHGAVLQPMAYSDKEKNTNAVHSPSFTLIGESTPERFYEVLDEAMISEGLLPRFTIIEYTGKRPPRNDAGATVRPRIALVEQLAALTAQCLTLAHNRQVHNVPMTPEAESIFDAFDKWCDGQINAANATEVNRQLWNRAHLKALKMAALVAVGINYVNPLITHHEAQWATDHIAHQTNRLVAKFIAGDVGEGAGNEAKQVRELVKLITSYMVEPIDKFRQYGATEAMHQVGIIPYDVIQRRLVAMAAFRLDRIGATNSIKRALDLLITADDIAEIPKAQMKERFGRAPRAFIVTNPQRFAPQAD